MKQEKWTDVEEFELQIAIAKLEFDKLSLGPFGPPLDFQRVLGSDLPAFDKVASVVREWLEMKKVIQSRMRRLIELAAKIELQSGP